MKRNFVESIQTINIKFASVENFAEEQMLDREKAELKSEIAIAAYDGAISAREAKGLFSLFIF